MYLTLKECGLSAGMSLLCEDWVGGLDKVEEDPLFIYLPELCQGPLPGSFAPPRIDLAGKPDYTLHIYQFPRLSLSPRGKL